MKKFVATCTLLMTVTGQAHAMEQASSEGLSALSVRLFHDACIRHAFDAKSTASFVRKFPQLEPQKAALLKEEINATQNSQIWSMKFPGTAFYIVMDSAQNRCSLVSASALSINAVEKEFQQSLKAFNKSGLVIARHNGRHIDNEKAKDVISLSYEIPREDSGFEVSAGVAISSHRTKAENASYSLKDDAQPWGHVASRYDVTFKNMD